MAACAFLTNLTIIFIDGGPSGEIPSPETALTDWSASIEGKAKVKRASFLSLPTSPIALGEKFVFSPRANRPSQKGFARASAPSVSFPNERRGEEMHSWRGKKAGKINKAPNEKRMPCLQKGNQAVKRGPLLKRNCVLSPSPLLRPIAVLSRYPIETLQARAQRRHALLRPHSNGGTRRTKRAREGQSNLRSLFPPSQVNLSLSRLSPERENLPPERERDSPMPHVQKKTFPQCPATPRRRESDDGEKERLQNDEGFSGSFQRCERFFPFEALKNEDKRDVGCSLEIGRV